MVEMVMIHPDGEVERMDVSSWPCAWVGDEIERLERHGYVAWVDFRPVVARA